MGARSSIVRFLNFKVLITFDQRGLVFFFFGNHIQKCRSTKIIGRYEVILRFFFSLGFWRKKKTAWEIRVFFHHSSACYSVSDTLSTIEDKSKP